MMNREPAMITAIHRRHDMSDRIWRVLEPHLPGREGTWGGRAKDNRLFINAVLWILRGTPWRDLTTDYGDWKILIGAFVVGVTEACGKRCWSTW